MTPFKHIFLAAFCSLVCSMVLIQSAHAGRMVNRNVRQRARIHQGVQSGELTHREAHRARVEERHIRRMEGRAASDGQITPGERARIESAQDRASKDIYRMKHNDQERPAGAAATQPPVEAAPNP